MKYLPNSRISSFYQHGFTLIELLVVIAIIGILATAIMVGLNPQGSIGRSRDAQRRNDLEQYKNLIQQYAISHSGKYPDGAWGSYPIIISSTNLCLPSVLNLQSSQCLSDQKTGPNCSSPNFGYCYYGDSTSQTSYILFAKLENAPKPYWEVCSSGLAGAASAVPTSSTDCKVGL